MLDAVAGHLEGLHAAGLAHCAVEPEHVLRLPDGDWQLLSGGLFAPLGACPVLP